MAKNIVMCFDGTGAEVKANNDSNVALLYAALDRSQPSRQVTYYDPGVGTEAAIGALTPMSRALSKFLGLAFGVGLRHNLGEAYLWLSNHWEPGDQIFLFGFSRGAYTARALAGMLRTVGLFRPGSENLLSYLVAGYTRRGGRRRRDGVSGTRKDKFWDDRHHLAAVFGQPVDEDMHTTPPIAYMGLWDTVNSVGLLRWQVHWAYTNQLPQAAKVRHAVSIHEWRRPFAYSQVTPRGGKPALEEVWFTGVHSNVGGGLEGDRLSSIPLKWVLDGAIDAKISVDEKAYRKICELKVEDSYGDIYRMNPVWGILGISRRRLSQGAVVHQSVQDRTDSGRTDIPRVQDVRLTDAEWRTPRPLPAVQ